MNTRLAAARKPAIGSQIAESFDRPRPARAIFAQQQEAGEAKT